jgi:tetratricopeptide (TPR) repeat protein
VLLLLPVFALWAALPCRAQTAPTQSPSRSTALQAQRYVMDLTLDPRTGALSAKADVTFLCGEETRSLELTLNRKLNIALVRDSAGRAVTMSRSMLGASPRFAVRLVQACQGGGTTELHFEYAGKIHPQPPFVATPDFLLLRDDDAWYPHAGVFDFAENELTLRVPSGFEARTSGKLTEERREGNSSVLHWKTARAVNGCTVVVCLRRGPPAVVQTLALPAGPGMDAAAPFLRVEEVCNLDAAARLDTGPCGDFAERAARIFQRYAQMLGPPPEGSLTIVPGPTDSQSATGYSAPGLLVASDWAVRFAGVAGYAPEFLAHELAHQWFPNGVAPASASDGWLAESLAEYLAWRYLLEADPEAARVMVGEAMRDAVAYTPMRPLSLGLELLGGPLSERGARATLYQRGMLVFRTLETVIDRERVDHALVEFYKRFAGRKAAIADFRAVCEEIAGRKLGWFFDYFIQGTRIPTIELRRLPSESPGVAAGEIVVKDFPPEGSVRVEIRVRTAQGIVEHSVATRGALTPFTVNVPAPALGITVDPDLRVLRWTEAAERSKAQSALLTALPEPITPQDLPAAIDLYRRALAADRDDASRRAQCLHERLGELEWAHDEWNAALADLNAAINGHSIGLFETYLCRGKAYLYHGVVQLHERRPKEALKDAQAGMTMPPVVRLKDLPEEPIESQGERTLEQLLRILVEAATHY